MYYVQFKIFVNVDKFTLNIEEFSLILKLALTLTARIKTLLEVRYKQLPRQFFESLNSGHGTWNFCHKDILRLLPKCWLESFS